jgi:hypothetical protein
MEINANYTFAFGTERVKLTIKPNAYLGAGFQSLKETSGSTTDDQGGLILFELIPTVEISAAFGPFKGFSFYTGAKARLFDYCINSKTAGVNNNWTNTV